MVNPTYDGGQDGAEPTVTCRPGPLWPVVVHYAFLAGLLAGLVVAVVR
jgi:hypothetical protein